MHLAEAHMEWQNEAERAIQEVKKMVNLIMDHTGCPNDLWVMCSHYVVFLLNHLAQPKLQSRTPIEACYGSTPDIAQRASIQDSTTSELSPHN